jgi:crotonobetainyl-CoA:carnitine CoA-transferase CaiB-like acyl-CoA transferase
MSALPTELPPLDGVRVLDLSGGLAAAYSVKLLRDAGADVIRVERPDSEPIRPGADDNDGLTRFLRGGLRSVSDGVGVREQDRLLDWADIVVVTPAAGDRAGSDATPRRLAAQRPRLVVLNVTPFGLDGPWCDRAANEFTLQALSGSSGRRGDPAREPLAAGGRLAEWAAGLVGAAAGLATLIGVRGSGLGDLVDVSILEAATLIYSAYMPVAGQLAPPSRRTPEETGRYTEIPSVVPAADGWVGFATNSAAQFRAFATMIGQPQWAEDPELSRADRRGFHGDVLRPVIEKWTCSRTVAEILGLADELHIPAAPVGNGEVTPTLPQAIARDVFVSSPEGAGRQPRVPYQMSRNPTVAAAPAPRPGAHDAVIASLDASTPGAGSVVGASRDMPTPLVGSAVGAPLQGMRVFDLTGYWAGPFAAQFLGWLGADVIKVESVQRPDGTRLGTAYATAGDRPWEMAPLFHGANTGKRAVTLDLGRPAGQDIARQLLSRCDVLVENYSPRVVDRFGILDEQTFADNPGLIALRLPAWGLTGPWRDRPGFAQNMEQATGLAWSTGYIDDEPVVPRGPCDPIGGLHAVFAVLAAVWERGRSGRGQLIEAPLFDSAVNVAAEQVIDAADGRPIPGRIGNRGPLGAPQGIYRCGSGSGWLALSVEDDDQWLAACAVLGIDGSVAPTEQARRDRADELDNVLADACRSGDRDVLVEALLAAGVPAAAVAAAEYVLDNPQLVARDYFETVQHPVAGAIRVPGPGVRWQRRTGGMHARPAPLLGEHNDEVLGGLLGLSADRLAELTAEAIIGTRPVHAG